MNKIKLFYQNNKKTIIITSIFVIIVTILLIIFIHKSKPTPSSQDIIKQAVDSAIAPIEKDIVRLQTKNDSLSKVIRDRQYRDVQRDRNILNNNNDIEQINKKLNEEINNTKHYNNASIDSFIFSRHY